MLKTKALNKNFKKRCLLAWLNFITKLACVCSSGLLQINVAHVLILWKLQLLYGCFYTMGEMLGFWTVVPVEQASPLQYIFYYYLRFLDSMTTQKNEQIILSEIVETHEFLCRDKWQEVASLKAGLRCYGGRFCS